MTCEYKKSDHVEVLHAHKYLNYCYFNKILLFHRHICTQTWDQVSDFRNDHQRQWTLLMALIAYLFFFDCRYRFDTADVTALMRGMPVLQSFEYFGLSLLSLPDLSFPWFQDSLHLPLNLSRTPNFNNQYSETLGTDTLPPHLYR